MEILALNYEYPPLGGGGGVVFQQIMEALAQRHHISVLTSAYGDLPRFELMGNLEVHRVPVWGRKTLSTATMRSMLSYWPMSLRRGRQLVRGQRFDLINSHFVVPTAPSADRLARQFGIPHVVSIHGGDIFDPSKRTSPHRLPVVRGFVRRLLSRADRVAAQSNNTADNARRWYGVRRKIDIIPLGIAPCHHAPATRAELGIEDDRFVIVTVGRLVARKAVEDLLHVVAELDDPRDLLLIVGDGPKRDEWEALARKLGIVQQVRFAGFVEADRKAQLLAVADVFASTSLHEGFGLVFLEAMDLGLPIVTYDHGGQTDFLQDGQTGRLIPFKHRQAFTEALRQLKDEPTMRRQWGEANRRIVKDYYIDRCAEQYECLFAEVLAHRCQRSRPGRVSERS